jgi:hypothetical protein
VENIGFRSCQVKKYSPRSARPKVVGFSSLFAEGAFDENPNRLDLKWLQKNDCLIPLDNL